MDAQVTFKGTNGKKNLTEVRENFLIESSKILSLSSVKYINATTEESVFKADGNFKSVSNLVLQLN
jgi:hypothetical protein